MALLTLDNTFGASVSGSATKMAELSTLTDIISQTMNVTFSKGVEANQADGFFHDERTLADGANETLDLTDSSLTDKLGEPINFSKLKALVIVNTSIDACLLIGGAVSAQMALFNAVTEKLKLRPGGVFMFLCPDLAGVDISVNAKLKLEHDGTGTSTLIYRIMALGVQG